MTTPFGASMRSRGLVAYDEAALRQALDALAAEHKDSDGDAIADVDELKAKADPNAGAGGSAVAPLIPDYGCSLGSRSPWRHGGVPSFGAFALVLAFALIRLRCAARRGL